MNNQITDRLHELLCSGQDINLAEAALLLAKDEYPALNIESYLGQLDELARHVRVQLSEDAGLEATLVALNHTLFDEIGFAGNTDDYYDPRNSFLNDVLDRKLGIPITLSILYMEIGRRLGIDLEGVSFPGHFLVKFSTAEGDVILDPYAGGSPVSEEDLVERLEETYGEQAAASLPLPQLLAAADKKEILVRMLRNLKGIYLRGGSHDKALTVVGRILQIAPESAEEHRDRGELYERMECFRAALDDYRAFLAATPEARDAANVRLRTIELERRVSRLN